MTDPSAVPDLLRRIDEYFQLGGLWNPECMTPQRAVADLLDACRIVLGQQQAQIEALTTQEADACGFCGRSFRGFPPFIGQTAGVATHRFCTWMCRANWANAKQHDPALPEAPGRAPQPAQEEQHGEKDTVRDEEEKADRQDARPTEHERHAPLVHLLPHVDSAETLVVPMSAADAPRPPAAEHLAKAWRLIDQARDGRDECFIGPGYAVGDALAEAIAAELAKHEDYRVWHVREIDRLLAARDALAHEVEALRHEHQSCLDNDEAWANKWRAKCLEATADLGEAQRQITALRDEVAALKEDEKFNAAHHHANFAALNDYRARAEERAAVRLSALRRYVKHYGPWHADGCEVNIDGNTRACTCDFAKALELVSGEARP